MRFILSPAKKMLPRTAENQPVTRPRFLEQTASICRVMRRYSPWELETLLDTNPELALLAARHYADFDPEAAGYPAVLSYHGLAYINMGPLDFTPEDFRFANRHLRLLSGFYGVLLPSDGVQPYRLQLSGKVRVDGKTLYEFWGDRWHRDLYDGEDTVINLCSKEFSSAVTPYLRRHDNFITCDFLVPKAGGKLRCVVNPAKSARGQMARYLIKNSIDRPQGMCDFEWDGFRYRPDLSHESRYVFVKEVL